MDLVSQVLSGNDDFLSTLPSELLFRVALQLDFLDIQRLCRVSRVFRQLCQDDYFWLTLYRRDISKLRSPPASTSVRQSYQRIMTQFSKLRSDPALVEASRHGYERLVNKILQKTYTPNRAILNQSLVQASVGGHGDIVNQMLQRGANEYNWAMLGAAQGGHLDIVNQLIKRGANEYNWAMVEAAQGGHQDIVNQMLDFGATDYNGAMAEAAEGGHTEIVKQMLDLGATNYNQAMANAKEYGHQDIVNLIQKYQSP
jgi:hypothetical protein